MKLQPARNYMIGTGLTESGGIASVLKILKTSGLLEQWNIELIQTHTNKSRFFGLNKAYLFACSLLKLTYNFLFGDIGFAHIHISSRGSFTRKSTVILLCKLCNVPVILHLHGSEFQEFYNNESSALKKLWIRTTFDYCDKIIVLSTQWKSWVQTIVREKGKISIIYNAVASAPGIQIERIPRTVLFLGRLGQRKGVFDLLEASRLLVEEFPDFKLILGGDGDIKACQKIVNDNFLENNVTIAGWINGDQKEKLLSTSDVFVLPSYNEGFPMSILEAMSAGIPIIASNAGGIPDAITSGIEGTLIDAGDVPALYSALRNAFIEREKYQVFSVNAKLKFEQNFSLPVISSQLSSLYSNVLSTDKNQTAH